MARHKLAVQHNTATTEEKALRRAYLYRGLCARVARDLELELSHVCRVARRERRSRRVEQALLREMKRIEAAA
jgi:hypothetical protein